MFDKCPCCSNAIASLIHQRHAQVLLHVPLGTRPRPGDFAALTVVRCDRCGHIYNRDFDSKLLDRVYGDVPPTNIPVHPGMLDRLSNLTDWIGAEHFAGKTVLEVGGGTGHFAFALARQAKHVTVFEPCCQLPANLGLTNVSVVNSMFPGGHTPEPVDFVACRQTIEHVVSPLEMMRAMRAALLPGGLAYFEVPRAEFIAEHVSPVDLHIQHVHYFNSSHFLAFAARAGFAPIKKVVIAAEHDFGYLFSAVVPEPEAMPAMPAPPSTLGRRMDERIAAARARLASLGAKVALFGANTMAQAALSLFGDVCRIHAVFDDNGCYDGLALYDNERTIAIHRPSQERVAEMDAIVIAAFLHDRIIAQNLRTRGYAGRILSMRPTPVPENGCGLESVYDKAADSFLKGRNAVAGNI